MKIVVDLQARQTAGSGERGIGRYSLDLAKALARNCGPHRLEFLLNSGFAWDENAARLAIGHQADGITFETYRSVDPGETDPAQREFARSVADELINWRYACSQADVLHVSSMFEGWYFEDAHVTRRLADIPAKLRTATLYDLIPHLFADVYLPAHARPQYYDRLALFHQLDLIFAISECTRRDAISTLRMPADRIINIGAAAGDVFHKVSREQHERLAASIARHGVRQPFVLCVSSNDIRKNNGVLLAGFAGLPASVRNTHQLVIVCALTAEQRHHLLTEARTLGIAECLVLTGHVSDEELNKLYNLCALFVFPSWYEGFGLPVLEAMQCGACVIASDCSSMPEIVGRSDVLFKADDIPALAHLMRSLLESETAKAELAIWNENRARAFSWDRTAQTMISALEQAEHRRRSMRVPARLPRKPKIALVSAGLSPSSTAPVRRVASMLPFFAQHLDITLVASDDGIDAIYREYSEMPRQDFECGAGTFDAAVYYLDPRHAGDILAICARRPGLIVLPDSFVSSVMSHVSTVDQGDVEIRHTRELTTVGLWHARGLIFESEFSLHEIAHAFPRLAGIPSAVVPPANLDMDFGGASRLSAKDRLGLPEDSLVICVLEMRNLADLELLLEAANDPRFRSHHKVRMIWVPGATAAPLARLFEHRLAEHGLRDRVAIRGCRSAVEHRDAVLSGDIAICCGDQADWRTLQSVMASLATGSPVVVGARWHELPQSALYMVPKWDLGAICDSIATLACDDVLRADLGNAARRWALTARHPMVLAEMYRNCVEDLVSRDLALSAHRVLAKIGSIVRQNRGSAQEGDLLLPAIGEALADGVNLHPASARRLADAVQVRCQARLQIGEVIARDGSG